MIDFTTARPFSEGVKMKYKVKYQKKKKKKKH